MKSFVVAVILCLFALPGIAEPMAFKSVWNGGNCRSCAWTVAEGDITRETPAALRAFLAAQTTKRTLQFNSTGGDLAAALEIGRIIRANDLATEIGKTVADIPYAGYEPDPEIGLFHKKVEGGMCESACAFAFLAGTERGIFQGEDGTTPARLGLHQFFLLDGRNIPTEDTQKIMGQVLLYVLEMGINAELLTIAAGTPPDDMHYLTSAELGGLGVLPAGGPVRMGLAVRRGGLAVEAQARLASGAKDRSITLRCSKAAQGWTLQVRYHEIGTGRFETYRPTRDRQIVEIGPQEFVLSHEDILDYVDAGAEPVLDMRLPGVLPVYSGQTLHFYGVGLGYRIVEGAEVTLPDAETFSVLARACGD